MHRPAPSRGSPVLESCRKSPWPRRGVVLAALGVLMLAAGCRADIVVDIDIAHDGAGKVTVEVSFDPDVMQAVPDLAELLVFDDLVGWDVSQQLEHAPVGERLRVVASKRFGTPAELAEVLAEIDQPADGSAGLFRSATFVGSRDGARVLYELSVTVGLDRPVAGLVNPATADALEGELFGLPIDEIEARAGAPLDELVTLVVQATVPQGAGRLPVDDVMTLNEGGTRVLRVSGELFDAEIAGADAEAERLAERASRGARIAVIWWIVLGLIVVVVVVVALRSRRRRLTFR